MENPFEVLAKRLTNIESLLLDIKHKETSEKSYTISELSTLTGYDKSVLFEFIECRLQEEKEPQKIINQNHKIKIGDCVKYISCHKIDNWIVSRIYPKAYKGNGGVRLVGKHKFTNFESSIVIKTTTLMIQNPKYL
jgi:hypothetical protein